MSVYLLYLYYVTSFVLLLNVIKMVYRFLVQMMVYAAIIECIEASKVNF